MERLNTLLSRNSSVVRLISLLVILSVMVLSSLPGLADRYVDGRQHRNFGNGNFLRRITQSIETDVPDLRNVFGLTHARYDADRNVIGLSFYNHHGVLGPLLGRVCVSLFGSNEWVVRVFALGTACLSTLLIESILFRISKNPAVSILGTIVYASLPLRVYYLTSWKYESITELLLLSFFFFMQSYRSSRFSYVAAIALAFFACHTDWPAFLVIPVVLASFFLESRKEGNIRPMLPIAVSSLLGAVTCVLSTIWLGFASEAADIFTFRVNSGLEDTSAFAFLVSQWIYVQINFTDAFALLTIFAATIVLFQKGWWKDHGKVFGLAFFAMNLVWCIVFRNHVQSHNFAQWFFAPAGVILLTNLFKELSLAKLVTGCILLLGIFAMTSHLLSQNENTSGTGEDIDAILSLDRTLVFFEDGLSGDPNWWKNGSIRYYTDPLCRRSENVGLVPMSKAGDLPAERACLVIWKSEMGAQWVSSRVQADSLRVIGESPSLIFCVAKRPSPPN
ncbi:MAG: hypothetical protein AAFV88_15825 [Planctomycetota bacterium]